MNTTTNLSTAIIPKDSEQNNNGDWENSRTSLQQLKPKHLQQLTESGIPCETAQRLGIYSADESEVMELLGRRKSVGSGMVIPYDFDGSDSFVRIRLDDPAKAATSDNKPPKYLSKAGSGQRPYIIPEVAEKLAQGLNEIILVEGEKKAIAANCYGFPAIGLSGNWGWKITGRNKLLPELDRAIKLGTTVTIVWDSDAALNTAFAASTRMLHGCLLDKDCTVRVIVLPQKQIAKVGLDDFLVKEGPDALRKLIEDTTFLPMRRVVEKGELVCDWHNSLFPAIESIIYCDEMQELLSKSFSKGFIYDIDHNSRKYILKSLESIRPGVVDDFNAAVKKYLEDKYPGKPEKEPTELLEEGQKAFGPKNVPLQIIEIDGETAWVHVLDNKEKSYPIPLVWLQPFTPDGLPAAFLAETFLKKNYKDGHLLLLRHYREDFYRWETGGYKLLTQQDLEAQVLGFLRNYCRPYDLTGKLDYVIKNFRADDLCYIPSDVKAPSILGYGGWRPTKDTISFANGNLHVDELLRDASDDEIFTSLDPELFTVTQLSYDFDPKAECPRFLKFLRQVQPVAELRELLQELAGYCLLADNSLQRFFILFGNGANGKGVFSNILINLVGAENTSAVSLTRFGERFALWPLTQKLVNIVSELPEVGYGSNNKIAEEILKAVVAGDPINVERKNRDTVTAVPTARLLFCCNILPNIRDRSNGTWRRMIIVPFDVSIPTDQQDTELAQRIIKNEMSGVFNWALEGLLRLRRRGYFDEPEISKQLKEEHRYSCAPELAFLQEHIEPGKEEAFIVVSEVYNAYRTYCASYGQHPMNRANFGKELKKAYNLGDSVRKRVDGKQERIYYGLKFTDDTDATENLE